MQKAISVTAGTESLSISLRSARKNIFIILLASLSKKKMEMDSLLLMNTMPLERLLLLKTMKIIFFR